MVAGFLLAFPRTQTTIDVPPEPFRSAMRIGLAYALAEPVVRNTLVRSAAFFGCANAIWALLPLYVRQVRSKLSGRNSRGSQALSALGCRQRYSRIEDVVRNRG